MSTHLVTDRSNSSLSRKAFPNGRHRYHGFGALLQTYFPAEHLNIAPNWGLVSHHDKLLPNSMKYSTKLISNVIQTIGIIV